MSERSYVIGLPVVITIDDDGKVTAEVDLSEATDIHEDEEAAENYGDEQVTADRIHIDNTLTNLSSMFRTINLSEEPS